MPELPDVELYCACLRERIVGQPLRRIDLRGPALLRTFDPPLDVALDRRVRAVTRLGKRIVLELDGELFLVFHLMIAGRFLWNAPGRPVARGKRHLAAFHFPTGTLLLTEAGTQRRATLHVVAGRAALAAHDPGGIDPRAASLAAFRAALLAENRTLKRVLTDPRRFSGIGNAYSDEILHAARLSPTRRTHQLDAAETGRLRIATRDTLVTWIERLAAEFAGRFPGPGQITAFRPDFAVHGRFGKPCPVCGTAVQRIRYADNEVNYCPRCQTGGRLLADRSLSRLLRGDWPRGIDELE